MDATRLMTQTGTLHLRTIVEDGPTDPYGNPTPTDIDRPTRCFLTPSRRADEHDETAGLASIQTETYDLFLPEQDLDGLAGATVDGVPYEIIGPPSRWYHPKARRTALLQATVRRAG